MNLLFIPLIIFAYLLGAIPFGLLIAKAHGKDLRKIGSGNIGATNVSRALGKKWAYLCFALDVSKGLIPMLLAMPLAGDDPNVIHYWLWLFVGCSAVLGHVFPVYLKFKGGKGMATSLGIVLGLFPYYTISGLIAFAVWGFTFYVWRYVSLGSIIAAITFPLALIISIIIKHDWQFTNLWPLVIVSVFLMVLIVVRHAANIKRLIAGTENKISKK
jgi:acyl phosphate:glycerol-3-phosphate acyltransferase